jgi:demethylmenaquinone methyltransferase/2-methoxy-6-polyprenyl-1,4-benzoquinol methylase
VPASRSIQARRLLSAIESHLSNPERMMRQPTHAPVNPPYARIMAGILGIADPLIRALRAQAVQQLELKPGDHVLDVGCGTGSNFPYLRAAVGPAGQVVGIEISPYLAAKARKRIQTHDWQNVQVIVAAAQCVQLTDEFAGLLLFAAHEVLTSPAALDNLLAHMHAHAPVVAFGAKQVQSLPGALLNPLLRGASKHWLAGAAPIDAQPWRLLEQRVARLTVEEHAAGLFYMVAGTVSPHLP